MNKQLEQEFYQFIVGVTDHESLNKFHHTILSQMDLYGYSPAPIDTKIDLSQEIKKTEMSGAEKSDDAKLVKIYKSFNDYVASKFDFKKDGAPSFEKVEKVLCDYIDNNISNDDKNYIAKRFHAGSISQHSILYAVYLSKFYKISKGFYYFIKILFLMSSPELSLYLSYMLKKSTSMVGVFYLYNNTLVRTNVDKFYFVLKINKKTVIVADQYGKTMAMKKSLFDGHYYTS